MWHPKTQGGGHVVYVVLDLGLVNVRGWLFLHLMNFFQMVKRNHKNMIHGLFARRWYCWESKWNRLIVKCLLMCSTQIFNCCINISTKTWCWFLIDHCSNSISNSIRSAYEWRCNVSEPVAEKKLTCMGCFIEILPTDFFDYCKKKLILMTTKTTVR